MGWDVLGKKILLIDDDHDLGRLVDVILHPLEMTIYQSYSGHDGLRKFYEVHPDLVILDVMMPDLDGFDVCARLRDMSSVPILMLTSRAGQHDMLHGFSVGADDFVRKPFNKSEFEARIRALLRRSHDRVTSEPSYILAYEDSVLSIDLSTETVKLNDEILELSPREYDVLACLVREQGKIVSKHELAKGVWGDTTPIGLSNPSLYVFYLRKKIQDGSHGHHYIHTLWGRGYWFEPRKES
jgi:two-component system KDP operon response regulator KdpE